MVTKKTKEIFAVSCIICILVLLQRRLWITRELMVSHDTIIWYGVFSYFADALLHGFFPFWNPYMNCGEPFFLNIGTLHLLDPSALFLIFIGKLFKANIFELYHYDFFLRYVIFILGSYFFFRYIAKYKLSALIATITITFSSLGVTYLRQQGYILPFYLVPWILLTIMKYLEQGHIGSLIGLAFLLGIMLPSQHSMFPIVFLFILCLSLVLTKGLPRPQWKIVREHYRVVFASIFILFLLTVNSLPVYLKYIQDVIPTVRIFEAPLAASASPADFFNLVIPYSFIFHFFNWYYMSDAFLYIGLIPLLLCFLGIYFSKEKHKMGFLITALTIALLMLGDRAFLYPVFNRFFPLFSLIRNMSAFAFIFIFCLVYFTCLGCDVIFQAIETDRIRRYEKPIIFISSLILVFALFMTYYLDTISQFLITTHNILQGYLSPNTVESLQLLRNVFPKLIINLGFFGISMAVIIFSLRNPKISLRIKAFLLIFFILMDLAFFNHAVFSYVTKKRSEISFPVANTPGYSDFRIAVHQPQYPFYAFAPAMLKMFTAYSTKIPWITTHFYETKNFYEFINDEQIPREVKDVLMGISAPKLRFIHKGIVLSHYGIKEELKKMNADMAKNALFIEEDQSVLNSKLVTESLDGMRNAGPVPGKITVVSFNPNEIILKTNTDEDCFLYYSDGFDKAWRVFVDGKEGKVYKTNLAFKSAIIEKGDHSVRFIYDPKFYKFGLLCYFVGLLIVAIIFIKQAFSSGYRKINLKH